MTHSSSPPFHIAVIGGGPAGLMAAQAAADQGAQVELFDAMPSVGRKFLLAGRGGMNITHAEGYQAFVTRYARQAHRVKPALDQFGPQRCATGCTAWASIPSSAPRTAFSRPI